MKKTTIVGAHHFWQTLLAYEVTKRVILEMLFKLKE